MAPTSWLPASSGDDPQKASTVHVGGIFNAFGRKDLSDEEKKELRAASISPKFAWKENAQAKCSYMFCVVDNDHVSDGVQVTI